MNLDVKISGFSRDVRALAKTFPKVMPDNMTRRFYEWQELRQLYRDADIVVISMFQSVDSAGITTLMEAMACGRPVIVTRTIGLSDYLQTPGTVTTVEPEDVTGLKAAIVNLLEHPHQAEEQAKCAYKMVTEHHNSEQYVKTLTSLIRSMG